MSWLSRFMGTTTRFDRGYQAGWQAHNEWSEKVESSKLRTIQAIKRSASTAVSWESINRAVEQLRADLDQCENKAVIQPLDEDGNPKGEPITCIFTGPITYER